MKSDSSLISKGPCGACGSSDGNASYSDGHTYCFVCEAYGHADGATPSSSRKPKVAADIFYSGDFQALRKRGISEETCRKFGYKVGTLGDGRTVQVAPYYRDGVVVGTKVRPADKDGIFSTGDMGEVELFGQSVWGSGGRCVVVTEGEIDAMSVSEVQANKWPVVSIPKGAKDAAKSVARNLAWLCTFETVVLMFDMDEHGAKAAAECAPLFPPGKCKVASLARKDPNELLQAGEGAQIVSAIWQAKPYRPDGIVRMEDIFEEMIRDPEQGLPWWSDKLTEATFGRRYGEVYGFGAGTGIGKTDFLTQQIQFDVDVLNQPVGLFFLEQKPAETGKRIAGKFASKCFHVPDGSWTREELIEAATRLKEDDRLHFYDNFGSADWDVIAANIRFMVHDSGVRIFFLDHLTALADTANEKESLEGIMKAMAMLAQELGIIIHFVSHLTTPDGTPHEEGGRVAIRHFKGSRAIGFWSFFMFGLERNQQHEDERWRSITLFRVLKDRFTGRSTGKVIHLGYDSTKGRLFQTEPPGDDDGPRGGFQDETPRLTQEWSDDIPF